MNAVVDYLGPEVSIESLVTFRLKYQRLETVVSQQPDLRWVSETWLLYEGGAAFCGRREADKLHEVAERLLGYGHWLDAREIAELQSLADRWKEHGL